MTTITTQASDDDFDRVEQGIDWIEKLEGIRARRDRDSALAETVQYVDRLRAALSALTENVSSNDLSARHGAAVAQLVDGIRDPDTTDPWTEYLMPSLVP